MLQCYIKYCPRKHWDQYFFYRSLLSGSNLPHAAITEALSPALKLDKAAESKVGISLWMNHASSPIKEQVCNIALLNSQVSWQHTITFFAHPRSYSIFSGMRCWRGLAMPEANLFPHWPSWQRLGWPQVSHSWSGSLARFVWESSLYQAIWWCW